MSASLKLSAAVKALHFLADSYPEPKSSSEIASKIGHNPSKLRKILSFLAKEEIVSSIRGKTGGFVLVRSPDEINLQQIYCSVEFRKAFYLDVSVSQKRSIYNKKFNDYFLNLFSEVQVEIENKMSKILLSDVIKSINNLLP